MKSMKSIARIAATLLCLFAFATASFAATPALALPRGLAVDSKGDLWVANSAGNNILVYSPSYVLQKSKTTTAGISDPWGVAFDLWGNLWVANNGSNSITEYTGGQQNTTTTITYGVMNPQALAFDAENDLWVQNNSTNLTIYVRSRAYGVPANWVQMITPGVTLYGIAIGAGAVAIGTPTQVVVNATGSALVLGTLENPTYVNNNTGFAMACDASGKIYTGNLDGSVQIGVPSQGANGQGEIIYGPFLQLPFASSGIAVDNVRGRVYFSNYNGNSISVYSTAGALLRVIQ